MFFGFGAGAIAPSIPRLEVFGSEFSPRLGGYGEAFFGNVQKVDSVLLDILRALKDEDSGLRQG